MSLSAVVDIPGLSPELRDLFDRLNSCRRYIRDGESRLVVYADPIDEKDVPGIVELIHRGLMYRVVIGVRRVLRLGTWDIVEQRSIPTAESGEVKTVRLFSDEMERYLLRYDENQRQVLSDAFHAFSACRQRGRMAHRVKLQILRDYDRYPSEIVIKALREYLKRRRTSRKKMNERSAMNIVRDEYRKWKEGQFDISQRDVKAEQERLRKEQLLQRIHQEQRAVGIRMSQVEKQMAELSMKYYGHSEINRLSGQQINAIRNEAQKIVSQQLR